MIVMTEPLPYFPTFYNIGGEWGFTCPHCKKFQFGYSQKAYAEDGMLDHYDDCESFTPSETGSDPLRVRNEVQDYGVGCNAPIGSNVRNTYGRIR